MGRAEGFLEYQRAEGPVSLPQERVQNFKEFHGLLKEKDQECQAARCMDCGVPFCQSGAMIGGMMSGCPLHNSIPEMNDLICKGNWKQAYRRLIMTHSFPEFTGRVCPALCEKACTCGLHDQPVTTRENELALIEYAFAQGLVKEEVPPVRTGKRVAVVGSGPAGLAAARLLNQRGHLVTVYERNDRVGGLLRYGIPNMKLDKSVIDRRVRLMEGAGISFLCGVDVGRDLSAEEIRKEYDAVVLACGASNPRDIKAPGREAEGIFFAVDFLGRVTKSLLDQGMSGLPYNLVRGKHVVVIGGGDTGNDCVGTAVRLGAESVVQLEMMPKGPAERRPDNPWPQWPRVGKTDYGQEEVIALYGGDPRLYQTTVKEYLKDQDGKLRGLMIVSLESRVDPETGRRQMAAIEGSEKEIPADLVLIAAGFLGSEDYVAEAFGVERDQRTNILTKEKEYETSQPGIFAAGDMHLGQSLVVRAIAEGQEAAMEADRKLMGYSK